MRVEELVALTSWEWFDVVHLHTVELASAEALVGLAGRVRREGKRLVVTAHDIQPNIESGGAEFDAKLAVVLAAAHGVATLTGTASSELTRRGVLDRPCTVVPHGAALPGECADLAGCRAGYGFAAYGALRPNRDFCILLEAWEAMPPDGRPPLRILLRTVSDQDERRDKRILGALRDAARRHPDMTLEVCRDFLPAPRLAAWLRRSHTLVLPYRGITHSGQLEAAIDVGLQVVAPDEPTLREQLATGPAPQWPIVWFPVGAMADGASFSEFLGSGAEKNPIPEERRTMVHHRRRIERELILDSHAKLYGLAS